MGSIDYFYSVMHEVHNNFLDAVNDLTEEQLYFRPLDKGNHIAFTFWHLVRTEDLVINFLLQKKPAVWNEQGWDKKLGMDLQSQGTGMSDDDAARFKITDIREFINYAKVVFETTEAYLKTLKDEDLEVVHDLPVMGERSLYQIIGTVTIQHAAGHLSETWYIKGLMGLQGSAH